jgi:hypothetical protein
LAFWAQRYRRDGGEAARRAATTVPTTFSCATAWIAPPLRSAVADLLADLSRGLAASLLAIHRDDIDEPRIRRVPAMLEAAPGQSDLLPAFDAALLASGR